MDADGKQTTAESLNGPAESVVYQESTQSRWFLICWTACLLALCGYFLSSTPQDWKFTSFWGTCLLAVALATWHRERYSYEVGREGLTVRHGGRVRTLVQWSQVHLVEITSDPSLTVVAQYQKRLDVRLSRIPLAAMAGHMEEFLPRDQWRYLRGTRAFRSLFANRIWWFAASAVIAVLGGVGGYLGAFKYFVFLGSGMGAALVFALNRERQQKYTVPKLPSDKASALLFLPVIGVLIGDPYRLFNPNSPGYLSMDLLYFAGDFSGYVLGLAGMLILGQTVIKPLLEMERVQVDAHEDEELAV